MCKVSFILIQLQSYTCQVLWPPLQLLPLLQYQSLIITVCTTKLALRCCFHTRPIVYNRSYNNYIIYKIGSNFILENIFIRPCKDWTELVATNLVEYHHWCASNEALIDLWVVIIICQSFIFYKFLEKNLANDKSFNFRSH